jgi:hypothetical protein
MTFPLFRNVTVEIVVPNNKFRQRVAAERRTSSVDKSELHRFGAQISRCLLCLATEPNLTLVAWSLNSKFRAAHVREARMWGRRQSRRLSHAGGFAVSAAVCSANKK